MFSLIRCLNLIFVLQPSTNYDFYQNKKILILSIAKKIYQKQVFAPDLEMFTLMGLTLFS